MAFQKDRKAEHAFFASGHPPALPTDRIRNVQIQVDEDGDFVFRFQNGERRYALAIVLSNASTLGWKECQALCHGMEIAERGTQIDNPSFLSLLEKLRASYGRVDAPSVQDGRLVGVVYPAPGTFRETREHTIMSSGIKFDSDGDLIVSAKTNAGALYQVCLETYPRGESLTRLDCQAFQQVMRFLEPGDHIPPTTFLAFGVILRQKYNFVTPMSANNGRQLVLNVLPTSAESDAPMHPLFVEALNKLRKEDADGQAAVAATPSGPSCPYPGITYIRALKESGQAQVYAAKKKDGTKVAVKVFLAGEGEDEGAVDTYKTELRMLLKMSPHRNVVEVTDFFETPRPALLMRLIDGEDLMDYLDRHGKCDEAEGRKLLIGIAKGLVHLHKHGIVHRDLKTLNILREPEGTPVIIDLGLGSVLKKSAGNDSNMTIDQLCNTMMGTHISRQTGAMIGTIPWMPPEMISEQKWSQKTDVYAFGVIMWEIFSGLKPFREKQGIAMLLGIAAGERPPMSAISHVSPELRNLIKCCWQQDPKLRPSMKRVLDLLVGNDPRQIFESIDTDKSGSLDFGEFVMFLQRYIPGKVEPSQMHALFQSIDDNNSGNITLDEFEVFWNQVERGGLQFAMNIGAGKKINM